MILDEACTAVEDLLCVKGLLISVLCLLSLLLEVLIRFEEHQVDRFIYFEVDVDHAVLKALSLLEGNQVTRRHSSLHGFEDFAGERWEAVHPFGERHLEAIRVEQHVLVSLMPLITLQHNLAIRARFLIFGA